MSVVRRSEIVAGSDWRGIPSLPHRRRGDALARLLLMLLVGLAIALLVILLLQIARQGLSWFDWQFLSSFPSRHPDRAGIKSALFGTLWMISFTALFSIPTGVASALYLEEFSRRGRLRLGLPVPPRPSGDRRRHRPARRTRAAHGGAQHRVAGGTGSAAGPPTSPRMSSSWSKAR